MDTREVFDACIMNDYLSKSQLKLDIPLYRYRGNIEYVIDEIINDHIYFSPLEMLNDPYDCSASLSIEECKKLMDLPIMFLYSFRWFKNAEWYSDIEKEIQSKYKEPLTLQGFCKLLSKLLEPMNIKYDPGSLIKLYYIAYSQGIFKRSYNRRVACFSETWDSIPMWSYYANSHKGVCLKYDFSLLDDSNVHNANIVNSLHKVWYSNIRHSDPENSFSHFMKSLEWSHEQEWRIVSEGQNDYLNIPCLTEIYLGIAFSSDQIDDIVSSVQNNPRGLDGIKIYFLKQQPNTYRFDKIPIKL